MNYNDYKRRKQIEYGEKFDESDLQQWAIRFFESGQRIKVLMYGEEITGTVGVTTGWKPVFILMRKSNSHGSSDTIGESAKLVAVQSGRKYYPVAP